MRRKRPLTEFPYYWRVRKYHPERFGQACRILVVGSKLSVMLEFEDGFRTISSLNYIRKRK